MAPTRGRVSSGGRGYGSYDRGRGRVAQVVVTHQMEAHHGHSAGCALNLGTLPIIVGIVLKRTMSRSNGLWLLHHLQVPTQHGTRIWALQII
jgi:hypothetical protein